MEYRMKDAIINSVDIGHIKNEFYWWSQLDYNSDTSLPQHNLLADKVQSDYDVIKKARNIIKSYRNIGLDLSQDFIIKS